jgi:phosphopantothenoylcysteine decarboxylase/phosphopantothenate--cysteine ligase
MLKNKKILLCITGSIAAYKSVVLLRLLIKNGASVKVIMTEAAKGFVPPVTFSSLSNSPVVSELVADGNWNNHVELGRWADLMLIAPASCNTIAKMTAGLCDNMLLAVYLSSTCPVMVAPAMDEDMWRHTTTKDNINKLKTFGNIVLPVNNGELASGLIGEGRMEEPEEILNFLKEYFGNRRNELKGKKALVTAGPTHEHLDPVRFIGNKSSGKMGVAIARELQERGAEVTLVIGPVSIELPNEMKVCHVVSAEEMFQQVKKMLEKNDIIVMAAAVADYTPMIVSDNKMKKDSNTLAIEFKRTDDILKYAGKQKSDKQILVGFALETNNSNENAIKKLREKNADIIVLNELGDRGVGFGYDTNKITIFEKSGKELRFGKKSKKDVARDIVNTIIKFSND